MTRFARAKGSKACNERTPEDGTPWEVMKEQLMNAKKENEDGKKRQEAEKQRIENYENFLKEQKVQKRKATWADFSDTEQSNKQVSTKKQVFEKKKNESSKFSVELNQKDGDASNVSKKKKKGKKNMPHNQNSIDKVTELDTKMQSEKQSQSDSGTINTADPEADHDHSKNKKIQNQSANHSQTQKKKKSKKLVNGKPVRRKEVDDKSFQLIIHGKEVELVRYDGFPVMKKDAERLEELKTSMIKKGIPKSEVQRTMKLERRRAEKALARVKREVCYNCRKGGHVLSDCPDLKSKIPGVDAAEGVCFKCGSTEHKQFECKVQRDKEFRFATCFICREAGHIARQCPDNPKGLYPNGGSCKLCGDVTHLRKDCPTVNTQKEETSMKLHKIDNSDNLEGMAEQRVSTTSKEIKKKPNKIKF